MLPNYWDYDPTRRHSHHGHVPTDGGHRYLNRCAGVTDSKSRDWLITALHFSPVRVLLRAHPDTEL
eukprot:2327359-Rhodomonas_salina.1